MRKRIFSLLACSALLAAGIVGVTGCGDDNKDAVNLKVWGPTEQQETLKTMVQKFKEANTDLNVNVEVGVCAEGDANATVSKDPSAAADVYAFANDQIVNLVRVGALAEIGGTYKTDIAANNGEGAVKAGQVSGKQYGYPYAADNGYFLYYDKSVVSEEQSKTLEGVLQACNAAGKKIGWPMDDSWYVAGWFFTFGGNYQVEYNDDGTEKSVVCNFATDGVGDKTGKAIAKLVGDSAFAGKGTNNDTITTNMGGTYAAAVTGTWNAEAIEAKLGDNYGVAKLPTVTVDGDTKQLSSFAGYKLYGVNPHTKHLTEAHKLAAFLSGEQMQALRFEKHKIGPSNTKVAATDAVKANPALAALSAQNAFAVAQTAVPENFWDPVKNFSVSIIDNPSMSAAGIKEQLDAMIALIKPKASLADCYLVGTINGWDANSRDENRKLTKSADGKTWTIEFTVEANAEVKVIQVDTDNQVKWSAADNLKIEEAGTYVFTYDLDTDTLTAAKK